MVCLFLLLILSTQVDASRFNMSFLYGNYDYVSLVNRTGGALNEVSPSYFDLYASGNLKLNTVDTKFVKQMHEKGIKVVPFLSNHWDRAKGRAALQNIDSLTKQIVEAIEKYDLDGVHIDIENVTEVDKNQYTLLVKTLREKLGREKTVAVAVAANPYGWTTGWHGSYDYENLGKYADYLLLMTYDEHYEGGTAGPVASISFVEKSIQYAVKRVDASKIVLGIPFFGRYWKDDSNYGGYGISLTSVEKMLKNYSCKTVYDYASQSPKALITIKSSDSKPSVNGTVLKAGTYTIWYENEESISAKLALVNQYKLKGSGSWSLGQEPKETWAYYSAKLNQGEEIAEEPIKPNALIASPWAEKAIAYVKEKGWMIGKEENQFYPKDSLTRAEFATILVRILQLEDYNVSNTSNSLYTDISLHWAKDSIKIMSIIGYMNGYEDGSFKPDQKMTREEVAKVLAGVMKWQPEKVKELADKGGEIAFQDMKSSRWSYDAVMSLARKGVINGYENGKFEPQKQISREEFATILERVF